VVQTCVANRKISFIRLRSSYSVKKFSCGDKDLNDFILNRATLFDKYAYLKAVPFYQKNGFRFMNSEDDDPHTRLMYFDLMDLEA